MSTLIQSCDETWNWLVGCSKISPGCKNCYAAVAARSARLQQFTQYQKVKEWDGTVEFVESQLLKPLSWRSPKRVFTCSMSDIFHPNVQDEWRDRAFAIMAVAQQHTFQVLTKRPQAMLNYFSELNLLRLKRSLPSSIKYSRLDSINLPLPNVWLGVSVENQQAAEERIPLLIQTEAKIRYLSCEPLLETVDLSEWIIDRKYQTDSKPPIHWVICGGESGTKARPCYVEWIRSLVNQCQSASIPVFVKQLGSNPVNSKPYISGVADVHYNLQLKDRKGGNINEFPDDLMIRQFPS